MINGGKGQQSVNEMLINSQMQLTPLPSSLRAFPAGRSQGLPISPWHQRADLVSPGRRRS